MDAEFEAWINYKIKHALRSMRLEHQRAPDNTRDKVAKKITAYRQIHDVLYAAWSTGVVLKQYELVDQCPLVQEGREETGNQDHFPRVVRMAIEDMRKTYHYPVVSRPGFSRKDYEIPPEPDADTMKKMRHFHGYYLPRNMFQVDDYTRREMRTIKAVVRSRYSGYDGIRETFDIESDPFELEKRAVAEADALMKKSVKLRAIKVVERELQNERLG